MNSIQDRKNPPKRRTIMLLSAAAAAAIFLFSLHVRTTAPGFIPPGRELDNLATFIHLQLARVFHTSFYLEKSRIMQEQPYYMETVGRLRSSVITAVCGAAVAAAGAVYQFVFRNDLASPSMLGVTGGISMAMFLLVLRYSANALYMTGMGYVYCYGSTLIILALVILSGKFSRDGKGGGKTAVMLLSGCVISQIAASVVSAGTNLLTQEDYSVYLVLSANGWGIGSPFEAAVFSLTLAVGFLPLLFAKNSMDLLSFSDDESRTMGVSAQKTRLASLVSGSLLVTASTIACSNVGIMAILMPHLSRYLFGVRFRDILASCMLYGASFLLICRMITAAFSYGPYSLVFTLNAVTGLLATPFIFIIMIIRGNRSS